MKMKPVALGAGLLLAASLCLLVGCGSGNKKSERSKESSSSKSSLSKSSAKPSSKTDINTNDNSSQNSEEGTSGNAQAGSGQTSTATQELATLQTSIQGKIALALAKMASQTPGMVSAERLKTEPNLTFSKKAVIYSTETERNIPVLDAAGRPLEEYRTGTNAINGIENAQWKVNEKLDTELREFKNYIFQSLLETCNQELNASFLYCNRSQCI